MSPAKIVAIRRSEVALLEQLDGLLVAVGRFLPVDDVEEAVDEVATGRAVVVVVRVFPDVEGEDRVAAPERALVVLVDDDVAKLVTERVVDEKRPATGGARGGFEFALPRLVGPEVLLDAVGEVAFRRVAAFGTCSARTGRAGCGRSRCGSRCAWHRPRTRSRRRRGSPRGFPRRVPPVNVALMVGVVVPREHLF